MEQKYMNYKSAKTEIVIKKSRFLSFINGLNQKKSEGIHR